MINQTLNDEYVYVLPSIRGISIYDSINYDYFDMEVLNSAQRTYLIRKLIDIGFIQQSGKLLQHKDGTKIYFPAQKLFNRNFKSFLPTEMNEDTWLALTPTQSAYMLLQKNPIEEEELFQLMMRHPFNLQRLALAMEHEDNFSQFEKLGPELNRLFERSQILLKNKIPLEKL